MDGQIEVCVPLPVNILVVLHEVAINPLISALKTPAESLAW
jgi:hypothetical protein